MRIVQIQFNPWDKTYNFDPGDLNLRVGDKVIVNTEMGREIGTVVAFAKIDDAKKCDNCESGDSNCECEVKKEIKPVERKASLEELERLPDKADREEALEICQDLIIRHSLPMKLVDVHFSFDGSRLTFAFIADGRIDFRELVKDLTRHYNRTIRLYQIGIRDEARFMGDCGHCGRELCCRSHLKTNLASITSEMAEVQQVVHRGSDRISGICGRLLCCLAYEQEGYEELSKRMPPLGAKVNVDGRKGIVVGHNILKQSVNVQFQIEKDKNRTETLEVDLNRNK